MRILSLYQPYATLMMLKLKRNETRCWSTEYRGPIGIHATAGMPGWCKKLCEQEPFKSALAQHGYTAKNLPRGLILGVVDIVGMMTTEKWEWENVGREFSSPPPPDEWEYGDYSPKRFAWLTDNVIRFAEPIPAKGHQKFWNHDIPESLLRPFGGQVCYSDLLTPCNCPGVCRDK